MINMTTSLPQILQEDPQCSQSNKNLNVASSTYGLPDSGLKEYNQDLSSSGPQASSGDPTRPVEFLDLIVSGGTSDGPANLPNTNFDPSTSVIASEFDPDLPDPKIPIIIPGPLILPPGIGTCKGNPGNKKEDKDGNILKTIHCCIHMNGVEWSYCTKFSTGFFCNPNREETVFACCKGVEKGPPIGPGIECEDAPGESVRRKTYGSDKKSRSRHRGMCPFQKS